jgi:uncharacterized protein with von Willebrand factor type A (vWA) domain
VSAHAYRYGEWHGGRDPLEPPFDVAEALDAIGDRVLDGASPRQALRDLLRRGADGLRGVDDLRRQIARRQREARRRGRLDGTLEEVRALLDRAIGEERAALFPDPSDDARLREMELETLPDDTARAVQQLQDYDWRSPEARQTYEQIGDLLRREVLDSQFAGMKSALESAQTPQGAEQMAAVKDMLADLNAMLEADARGEHTSEQFDEFLAKHGAFFPSNPQNLEELVDELARRAAAQQRLMDSLTPQQRQELGELMQGAMDADLGSQLAQLGDNLRAARPDLRWGGRERMTGDDGLGMGEGTGVLQELADLDAIADALSHDRLADVDEDAVQRALGRGAVDDLAALRRIERELEAQGYLVRDASGRLEMSPRAVRRLGATALRRVFAELQSRGRGGHDVRQAGAAGEVTGASRAWEFGDEQPLDVVRTVRNAVLRSAGSAQRRFPVQLQPDDVEVVETERRSTAAVALLVDLSYSMEINGTWGTAKQTALALHSLVSTRFPQDAVEIIGFSDYAQVLRPEQLAGLDAQRVMGTNLQHALMLAGRHLDRHPDAEPVVLVVTDGEPTAHLLRDGEVLFFWPPLPETLELTMAEVERLTRRGATINVFLLDDSPRLVDFVREIAARNGGRVLQPDPQRLGEYVVEDYLRSRRGRRRAHGR